MERLGEIQKVEVGREVPYRLARPLYPGDANSGACICYVVMKRGSAGGGFLAVIPVGFLTQSELQNAREGPLDGPIGPNTVLTVPSVLVMEDGAEEDMGDIDVLLVDFSVSVAAALIEIEELDPTGQQQIMGFLDELDAFPRLDKLLVFAKEWLEVQTAQRAAFYSAEEFQEPVPETPGPGQEEEAGEGEEVPQEEVQPKRKAAAKPKKVTTTQLADQINTLMETLPQITNQLLQLQEEQKELKKHVSEVGEKGRLRPSQLPVSAPLRSFAGMVGSPPKVRQNLYLTPPPQKLIQKGLDSQLNVQEQAEEMPLTDPLASAVLEQSKALTTLVSHLQQGGDPLLGMQEGASGSSLSSRGSAGRERLQKQLASRSGNFCLAVLQNAARRLRPAAKQPQTIQEAAGENFSIIPYLERYGGYGAFKELGLIQYAVAHIWDASVQGDIAGVQELTSLLMVGIEQAAMDSNRWEFAYKMMLLEEPPAQLWSFRSSGYDTRGRAFAPLAPQAWATTALAYSKEMDYVSSKRAEVASPKRNPQPPQPAQPSPRKKKFPKAKAAPSHPEEQ